MNALLPKLVTLAASLVLALTPGMCCGLVLACRAGSSLAQQACCQPSKAPNCRVKCGLARTACCDQTAKHGTCPSHDTPDRPCNSCCGIRDVTLPEKTIPQTESSNPVLPVVADNSSNLGSGAGGEAAPAFAHAGPRLHVLQCVWRC